MSIPRTISIPAAIAFVLVTVVSGVLIWWMLRPPTNPVEDESATLVPIETVQALALDDAGRGDLDAAFRLYDWQIAARPNGDEKRELLLSKSSLATSRGRFNHAIAAAQQVLSISGKDDPEALRALAEAYAASGDKTQALAAYKRILATAKKGEASQANGLQRGPSLKDIITELEQ